MSDNTNVGDGHKPHRSEGCGPWQADLARLRQDVTGLHLSNLPADLSKLGHDALQMLGNFDLHDPGASGDHAANQHGHHHHKHEHHHHHKHGHPHPEHAKNPPQANGEAASAEAPPPAAAAAAPEAPAAARTPAEAPDASHRAAGAAGETPKDLAHLMLTVEQTIMKELEQQFGIHSPQQALAMAEQLTTAVKGQLGQLLHITFPTAH